MQFSILAILALATSTIAGVLPPSDIPISRIKERLAQLDAYRNSHHLNFYQAHVFQWAESVITSIDHSEAELDAFERAALEAFGPEEMRAIFVDLQGEANSELEANSDPGLAPVCQCSSKSSYCGNGEGCKRRAANCSPRSPGCGTLLLRTCDGLCIRV